MKPKCLTGEASCTYFSEGYILPCCWANNKEFKNLTQEKLHLSNVNSIEDIVTSEEWQTFFDGLINNPDNAPQTCKNFCADDFYHRLDENS